MVDTLQQWQGIERHAMNTTAEIMEGTRNPLVRIIMEIIRHDSLMHHRVQHFLVDSMTEQDVSLTREEIADIWAKIEEHDKIEKKTIEYAEELQKKAWNPVHKHMLGYLLDDEKKHDRLLEILSEIKAGMTRASGA
jgi:rubrerythrin